MVALGAVAVPMLCVSEAGLGAGFVVMATGTGAVCSYVCCCDDGITGVGGKADVSADAVSVPTPCVSEAGLGAGFVVMATGAVPVRSSVPCGDDGMTRVDGKADVRCMLLSVLAVLGLATVRGFSGGAAEGVVARATVVGVTEAAGTTETSDVPALIAITGVTGPVVAAIALVAFTALALVWLSAC